MKELILMVLTSISDTNVINIKNEVLSLIEVKPSRWTAIFNWFKKKMMTVLGWALVKFPEVRSVKKIYDSLEAIAGYKKREMDKLVGEILDAVLVNFEEIEKKLELKKMCLEIEEHWDIFIEHYKKSSYEQLKELGMNFDTPKELIESIENVVEMSDDTSKDKNVKKITLILGALKSNFK